MANALQSRGQREQHRGLKEVKSNRGRPRCQPRVSDVSGPPKSRFIRRHQRSLRRRTGSRSRGLLNDLKTAVA